MRIIHLQQNSDEWRQHRIGKIGGSDAKGIMPLSRGKDRTPVGYWDLLAQKISIAADGEPVMDRGHRLEEDALRVFAEKYNLKLKIDSQFWESDINSDISVSPDGSEDSDRPTWAAEAKCLSSANHLKYVVKDIHAKQADTGDLYNGIDQIPQEYKCQVVQYFVVNDDLQTLYFVLHDDRIVIDKYVNYVIEITREEIKDEIELQKAVEIDTLKSVDKIIKELMELADE